jgi:lipopolysaccharide biosynthesis regulator YciM
MDFFWGMLLLCLLLPIAAMSGWFAAKKNLARETGRPQKKIPPEYLAGLNYVLNEQQDKAIDLFIKMLEVDSETVETHLALGNLFRKRGEVDRAIRIHQNLIARPELNPDHRSLALLELGTDYMRSGLFDRAEGLFRELVDNGAYTVQAYNALLDIYQQEKDWSNAVTVARRLETVSGERFSPEIAQFFCEIACEFMSQGVQGSAREYLRRALNMDPDCVRASLMEAKLFQQSEQPKNAIRALKRVELQDPDYLPEVTRPMLKCYREIGKLDDYKKYLTGIVHSWGGITPLLCLTELIEELEGREAAIRYLSAELTRKPAVRGVDRLVEYALADAEGEMYERLHTIKEMTGSLLEERSVYKCKKCGFAAKSIHWQCPGCRSWNTIKPVFGVEGE